MGLIRLLTILLLGWLAWSLYKNYVNKQVQQQQKRKLQAGRIVKCQYCDLHLPETQALQHDSTWFCTRDHMQAFLGNNTNSK